MQSDEQKRAAAYMRAWRKANPERWAELSSKSGKKYHQKNKVRRNARINARIVERYHSDPEFRAARAARNKAWRVKNRDSVRAADKIKGAAYARDNRDKHNLKAARRRARVRAAVSPDACEVAMLAVYAEASRLSEATGVPHEVDHIIPLSKGGLHHQDNLQVLTMFDNRSKGATL